MANIKISELTSLTTPAVADELVVVDVSASATKKTTVGELVGIISGDIEVSNTGAATISELPVSKLQDGAARQLLQTDAAGTGVEWTSNVDIPGTLDVTGAATFDAAVSVAGNITSSSAGTNYVASSSNGVTTSYLITDTSGCNLQVDGAWPIRFTANGSERVRITPTGLVGVGNTTGLGGTLGVSGNISLSGNGTGARYLALLNETNTYAGSYVLQAGGGSAGFGGAITMYGHSHATYPGSVYIGTSSSSGGSLIFGTDNPLSPTAERFRVDPAGRMLIGTTVNSGGALLQLNGDRIRVATAKTPASATDTGTAGEICWDVNYIYVCTATNTWKRTAISTW